MKKLFLILAASIFLMSCTNEEKVKSDIQELKERKEQQLSEVANLNSELSKIRQEHNTLSFEIEQMEKTMKMYESGETPSYVLELEMKQTHVSLDIGKHAKDAMNKVTFNIPVSKEFYEQVNVGDNLVKDFRVGSFIMEGSFGKWKIKVINKSIQ